MPDGISINAYRPDDLREIVSLLDRELHADPISIEGFERKVLLDVNFRADGALVARCGGRIVGFILALLRKHPLEDATPDFDRGWITLMAVDKDFQRRGIGSSLLGHATDFLRAGGAESAWVSPYAPNYFCPGVDEAAYPGAIRFLRKHGFETAYRPLSMELSMEDMRGLLQKARGIADVRFDIFRPEYIFPLSDLLKREFPGDWQRLVRETTTRIAEGASIADRLHLAMRQGECIGFCRYEGERFGPFGVAAAARGRGIGAVLLDRCLRSMSSNGIRRAWFAWTDDNAAKLYARFGFCETRRFSVMKREIGG